MQAAREPTDEACESWPRSSRSSAGLSPSDTFQSRVVTQIELSYRSI